MRVINIFTTFSNAHRHTPSLCCLLTSSHTFSRFDEKLGKKWKHKRHAVVHRVHTHKRQYWNTIRLLPKIYARFVYFRFCGKCGWRFYFFSLRFSYSSFYFIRRFWRNYLAYDSFSTQHIEQFINFIFFVLCVFASVSRLIAFICSTL